MSNNYPFLFSQTRKKHSVGLFDDFDGGTEDNDQDLFQDNKDDEDIMRGVIDEEDDGGLFGSSSKTSNGHARKGKFDL